MNLNDQIYEQASEWFIDFRTGDTDPARRKEFDTWIRKSPEHLRAYLEITEIWQDAPFTTHEATADELIVLATRPNANVIALEVPNAPSSHQAPITAHRKWLALAASLLIVISAAISTWYYQHGLYTTATAEQRTITLEDGSTIILNAQSRIRQRYTDRERNIQLLQGQAIFRVAHNTARPFNVHSGTTTVRAVGTQFDINRRHTSTTITVIEGKVAVTSGDQAQAHSIVRNGSADAGPIASLTTGEQLTVSAVTPANTRIDPKPKRVDVAATTSWTTGTLVFKTTPLAEVVEQFNRYNTRPLVVQGPGLDDFHLSGVYSSSDPTLLLGFLREQPGIVITETPGRIVISHSQ